MAEQKGRRSAAEDKTKAEAPQPNAERVDQPEAGEQFEKQEVTAVRSATPDDAVVREQAKAEAVQEQVKARETARDSMRAQAPADGDDKPTKEQDGGGEQADGSLPGGGSQAEKPNPDLPIIQASGRIDRIETVKALAEHPEFGVRGERTDNTNSVRSSAAPIDHPNVGTRSEMNPDRVALAQGVHSMPGQGHVGLVDVDGNPITDVDSVLDMGDGDRTFGIVTKSVYEQFTFPNSNRFTTRLFFAEGRRISLERVERLRMALQETAQDAQTVFAEAPVAAAGAATPAN